MLRISTEAGQNLLAYSCPGDMREMKNDMERAIILDVSKEILPEHPAQEIPETGLIVPRKSHIDLARWDCHSGNRILH